MNRIVASAPGKAVLLGEYAVLDGAPALALALDRRAWVEIAPAVDGRGRIEVPQLGVEPVGFAMSGSGELSWDCPPESWTRFQRTGRIIEQLLARARREHGPIQAFHARIDSGELFSAGVKLGLGSSAAVAVAVDAAITALARGRDEPESPGDVLERLLPLYRASQGGHGSGIDLACSLHGGLIGYRLAGDRPAVERLAWPAGLDLMFLWTGEAASTPDMVAAWRRWQHDDPARAGVILGEMYEMCDRALAAARDRDGAALARLIGAYGRILGTMGGHAGIEVVTGAHRLAMELAERFDAHCKPCGAGGGDLGVAAATDPRALAQMAEAVTGIGLEVLPLSVDADGVRLTMS
jgi:phosphomevalonate kinase